MRDRTTGFAAHAPPLRYPSRLRGRLALLLALTANAALLPAFVLVAPSSTWSPPVLLVAIAALALVGCFNSIKLTGQFLDAEFVAALLAVVLLGPLPGLCVWLAGELTYLILAPQRRQAHIANVASYGWAALAGALVLEAFVPAGITASDPAAWLAVLAAGAVMLCVNFAITTLLVGVVMDGDSLVASIRGVLIPTLPVTVLMVLTGVATAFGYLLAGIPALALFSAAVFIPRFAGRNRISDARADSSLDHCEALPLYADEIATALRLGAAERRIVRDAASFIRVDDSETPRGRLSDVSESHRHGLVEALIYKGEHWDGRGGRPGAVGGEMIPLTSRILAVADAWAQLTAASYPRLTDFQAVDLLQAHAGLNFDPAVVEAAMRVVEARAS